MTERREGTTHFVVRNKPISRTRIYHCSCGKHKYDHAWHNHPDVRATSLWMLMVLHPVANIPPVLRSILMIEFSRKKPEWAGFVWFYACIFGFKANEDMRNCPVCKTWENATLVRHPQTGIVTISCNRCSNSTTGFYQVNQVDQYNFSC